MKSKQFSKHLSYLQLKISSLKMINSLQMELYSRLIDFYHDRVSCDKIGFMFI